MAGVIGRLLLLSAGALVSACGPAKALASEEIDALPAFEAPMLRPPGATIPWTKRPRLNLDAVWWEAPRAESLRRLADRWGTTEDDLAALNPELAAAERVEPGARVLVYRYAPGTVSRSVGAPNRGRIENAAPFPQGEGWVLREFRPRSYATRQTVRTLALALAEWHERFPDANPVKLGELSKRGGGRVRPHKSHRTGRDVDIGYVMLEPDEGHRFVGATADSLDAQATWGLVSRLLASGAVESIFMANSVQEQLIPYAAEAMGEAELRATFSILEPNPRAKKKAAVKAVRGHDDHMHVRFQCTEADVQCRAPAPRKKTRRKARRRRR